MKIFTCTRFKGQYSNMPVAAVICAESAERAAEILENELTKINLSQDVLPEHMIELDSDNESARILTDGEY